MTGYALVRVQTAAGELNVALRSVNHRGLDLHFHSNGQLGRIENAMRAVLKRHIARGHVEIRVTLARENGTESAAYNRETLKHYLALFRQACEEFGLDSKPDLNRLLTLPGVFDAAREGEIPGDALEFEVMGALEACIAELNSYREREGRALSSGFEREIAAVEEQTARMSEIRAEAIPHFMQRLRERLAELLKDSNIAPSRLMEEAALLADKSDVQEELGRLVVHIGELRRIFENGGAIGKPLDFLLQEMNRETNTILSKTSGIGEAGLTITKLALGIKANIERMREQALNLE